MSDETERITRKTRIDLWLKATGWEIIHFAQVSDLSGLSHHAVEEFETSNGPADYGLVVGGRLLGLVEAKKLEVGAQNVLEQAKRYSKGAENTIGEWGSWFWFWLWF